MQSRHHQRNSMQEEDYNFEEGGGSYLIKTKNFPPSNENDHESNSAEITHLRNEICRLNEEIILYFEQYERSLSANKMDEKAYVKDKIYHADLEIIEQMQRKIFDTWSNPYNDSYVVNIRVKMSVNLKRVFARLIDHPVGIKRLKEDIDDMDEGIKVILATVEKQESTLKQKILNIQSEEKDIII